MNKDRLRQDLLRDEGVRLLAYRDSVGLWTIGCGHLLGAKPRMSEITLDEMHALLDYDMDLAEARLKGMVPSYPDLDEVRQRALVNMAFNLGLKLTGFAHFLDAVEKKDWPRASLELADSLWAKQVGQRSVRIRQMIETGEG